MIAGVTGGVTADQAMILAILITTILGVIVNARAFHRRTARRWMYLVSIFVLVFVGVSYALVFLGIVPIEVLVENLVMRTGVLMLVLVISFHGLVDW